MDFRIVRKDAFQVIGKTLKVTTKNGECFKQIPHFWEECSRNGTIEQLCRREKGNIMGICSDMNHETGEFTYMAAVEGKPENFNDGFIAKNIPADNWAVFDSIGSMPGAIQRVWERIYPMTKPL